MERVGGRGRARGREGEACAAKREVGHEGQSIRVLQQEGRRERREREGELGLPCEV